MSPPQSARWQGPKPSLGHRIRTALTRSFFSAPVALTLIVIFKGINGAFALNERQQGFFTPELIVQSVLFALMVWGLLFLLLLIGTSRAWSDRLFTVSGFLATFFGLAVLAVFFVRLGDEVVEWFHYTPILVQLENDKNQKVIDDVNKLKKVNEDELASLEKDRDKELIDATTEEEKKEVRELYAKILAQKKEDQLKTGAENQIISERSLRADTSRTGIIWYFLTNSPSDKPQDAGIAPALWGSIWLGLITILFAVPVGVGAALYLEEYRTEGWLAKIIQVNINNLAGVPSVVYGILGGFVFVLIFKKMQEYGADIAPRNLLGGGLTLGLLTLPMVIVSAQEAIRAVPLSLRQGAYALGATKWQVMWTIVLPMARPGILTGTILSLSRAIGEAAPLVLFGAMLFVDQNPSLFTRFTALPLQIFGWCDRPPLADPSGGEEPIDMWKYNAAVASTLLLIVLLGMNGVAIYLRNRAQRKMRY